MKRKLFRVTNEDQQLAKMIAADQPNRGLAETYQIIARSRNKIHRRAFRQGYVAGMKAIKP